MNNHLIQLYSRRLADLHAEVQVRRDALSTLCKQVEQSEQDASVTLGIAFDDVTQTIAEATRSSTMEYLQAYDLNERLENATSSYRSRALTAWGVQLRDLEAVHLQSQKALGDAQARIARLRDEPERHLATVKRTLEKMQSDQVPPKFKPPKYPLGCLEHVACWFVWGMGLALLSHIMPFPPQGINLSAFLLAIPTPFILRLLVHTNRTRASETHLKQKMKALLQQGEMTALKMKQDAAKTASTELPPLESAAKAASTRFLTAQNVFGEFQ